MNTLITKTKSALSGAVLFVSACIMAALGFAMVGTLALFAMVAVAVALLAAPFVKAPRPETTEA